MNLLALIPARMGSSRFPGKPMERINGKPMIGHVYHRVSQCNILSKTVVATCDKEIFDYIHSIDGNAIMTGDYHDRASDRCAEALELLEKFDGINYDIIVMVQGDEPMVHPDMIKQAIEPMLENPNILVANLLGKIKSKEEFLDRNCIKVVCNLNNNAMYFSREPIPTLFNGGEVRMMKQVCIIPFRRDFLLKYINLEPTELEIAESVDMMRVLENGYDVHMIPTNFESYAVDTPNDLKKVEKIMQNLT